MDEDDIRELFRLLREQIAVDEVCELNRLAALPSPPVKRLEHVGGNAVFIGLGGAREMQMPDFRPEYLIAIPRRISTTWQPQPVMTKTKLEVARFRLSSIQDGKAIYQFAGTELR